MEKVILVIEYWHEAVIAVVVAAIFFIIGFRVGTTIRFFYRKKIEYLWIMEISFYVAKSVLKMCIQPIHNRKKYIDDDRNRFFNTMDEVYLEKENSEHYKKFYNELLDKLIAQFSKSPFTKPECNNCDE